MSKQGGEEVKKNVRKRNEEVNEVCTTDDHFL